MRASTSISKVPEVIWYQVFKYCGIKDFVNLRLVCRSLKKPADLYTDIYEKECLRLFTSGLPLFEYALHKALPQVCQPAQTWPSQNHLNNTRDRTESGAIETDPLDTAISLQLVKAVSFANSRWQKLLRRGGRALHDWLALTPPPGDCPVSVVALRAIRDHIFSVLKGNLRRDRDRPTPADARTAARRIQRLQEDDAAGTPVRADIPRGRADAIHLCLQHRLRPPRPPCPRGSVGFWPLCICAGARVRGLRARC